MVWEYDGGCEYVAKFHRFNTQWHHPISTRTDIGIWLCQAHHSILLGRKFLYSGEYEQKTIKQIYNEIMALCINRVKEYGFTEADIDKH